MVDWWMINLKGLGKKLSNRRNIPSRFEPNTSRIHTSIEFYRSVYLLSKPIPDLLHMLFLWYYQASGLHQAVIRLWCCQQPKSSREYRNVLFTWRPVFGKLGLKLRNWSQLKRDAEEITFWNLTFAIDNAMELCGDIATVRRVRKVQHWLIFGKRWR